MCRWRRPVGVATDARERAVLAGALAQASRCRDSGPSSARMRASTPIASGCSMSWRWRLQAEQLGRECGRAGAAPRGLGRSAGSCSRKSTASRRKPSTPRRSQNSRDRQQGLHHRRVVQVQRGLAGEEMVQIILPPPRLPLPGAAAEHRQPVVGRRAVRVWGRPRRTSRRAVGPARRGFPGTRDGGRRCGSRPGRSAPSARARGRARAAASKSASVPKSGSTAQVIGHVIAEILLRRGEERAPARSRPRRARRCGRACAVMPGRSPMPSPLLSKKLRG